MGWTATVTAKRVEKLNVVATVRFDDGAGKAFIEDVPAEDLTDASLAAYCSRRIAGLEKVDAAPTDLAAPLAALSVGAVAQVPVGPTQAELDCTAYFVARERLRALQVAVDEGLVPVDDAEYVQLVADLPKAWRREYLDDMRWR